MSTAVMATTNRPADAYRAWRIAGLREPFFTKWLWAASCIGTPERRCLVLDARVWSTLNEALSWSSLVAAGTRRRAARYEAYVDTCHSWAAALGNGVSAEDVEWALFAANGDLARLGPSVDQAIEG